MTEFHFLDKQFRRLDEARGLRARDEKSGLPKGVHSAFETTELMIRGAIEDYLKMREAERKE